MKLLLTSGGITNPSIRAALEGMLGKPVEESHALCVPTAQWGHPMCGPASVRGRGGRGVPLVAAPHRARAGRRSGVLELTALPTHRPGAVGAAGSARPTSCWSTAATPPYLCHWMRESGLADLAALAPRHWSGSGVSAGSMVMTPAHRRRLRRAGTGARADDRTLGVVDFSIFPHLGHLRPSNTDGRRPSSGPPTSAGPAYAIDEQTAIAVVDGGTEVVSEGTWTRFDG